MQQTFKQLTGVIMTFIYSAENTIEAFFLIFAFFALIALIGFGYEFMVKIFKNGQNHG
jgi:hypothetical protein